MTPIEPEAPRDDAQKLGKKYVFILALALGSSVFLQIYLKLRFYDYAGYIDDTTFEGAMPGPAPDIIVLLLMPIWMPLCYWAFLFLLTRSVRRVSPQTLFPETILAMLISITYFFVVFFLLLHMQHLQSALRSIMYLAEAIPLSLFVYAYFILRKFKRQISVVEDR